jgi:hypothetical protein
MTPQAMSSFRNRLLQIRQTLLTTTGLLFLAGLFLIDVYFWYWVLSR